MSNIADNLRKKATENILLSDNMQKLLSAIDKRTSNGEYFIDFIYSSDPNNDNSISIFGSPYQLTNNEIDALRYYGFDVEVDISSGIYKLFSNPDDNKWKKFGGKYSGEYRCVPTYDPWCEIYYIINWGSSNKCKNKTNITNWFYYIVDEYNNIVGHYNSSEECFSEDSPYVKYDDE